MGMISEIHAQASADSLAKVLRQVKKPWWIWAYPFARTFIYPLYLEECSEAWSNPSKDLVKFYQPFRRK